MLAVENLAANAALGLAVKCELESFGHSTLTNEFHRLDGTVERLGYFRIRPVRTLSIGLEKDSRPPSLLRSDPLSFENFVQCLTFRIGQPNNILFVQGPGSTKIRRRQHPKLEM